jgi:nitroimidazol reductase NimA-like FMN-containing flavoprotein (pyridoxamine 5'-phosphate oxidase superfamily)
MTVETWLISIPPHECENLLATSKVGRLGVVIDGRPEIFPVDHVFDRESGSIAFPTSAGTKMHGALEWPFVAFEVDALESADTGGWSVAVVGTAEEITDPDAIARLQQARQVRWSHPGTATHWIRIVPTQITGRRIKAVIR